MGPLGWHLWRADEEREIVNTPPTNADSLDDSHCLPIGMNWENVHCAPSRVMMRAANVVFIIELVRRMDLIGNGERQSERK